jgi:excisionase family DNA binding protein
MAGDNSIPSTPWMTLAQAAEYLHRGRRFISREVRAGRLRAARIGGRGEILTSRIWCDQYVEDQATPIMLTARRRA